jgi:hypothetical protein
MFIEWISSASSHSATIIKEIYNTVHVETNLKLFKDSYTYT